MLAEVAYQGGEMLILETVFIQEGTEITGFILLTPNPSSLQKLMDGLMAAA